MGPMEQLRKLHPVSDFRGPGIYKSKPEWRKKESLAVLTYKKKSVATPCFTICASKKRDWDGLY